MKEIKINQNFHIAHNLCNDNQLIFFQNFNVGILKFMIF